jgi:hypothetical protein
VACALSQDNLRNASERDMILPMPQQVLAATPIHGEYRKRGDKVD